jgi:murein DD-endopeptidase MepM/ murein hydrolase activator NlpD
LLTHFKPFALNRLRLATLVVSLFGWGLAGAQADPKTVRTVIPPMSASLQLKAGVVDNNVFVSLSQAGVPDEVALDMVRELSQAINLEESVKAGDRFALLYEKSLLGSVAKNKLLAFEYTHDVTVYAAYWFEQSGQKGFYQEDGVSLRPAYLRTPIEIIRVSSNFGARKHPIRKIWLTHEGTDFAAPAGTRVFASGDGEVAYVGTQSGFGNVIKLKHPQDTQTVYAHLSAFTPGLKTGDKVKQGDVIGAVGSTGWATGPHLHYEYRVASKPIDPFSVSLPISNRISNEQTDGFNAQLTHLKTHFALVRKPAPTAAPAKTNAKPVPAE